MYFQNPLWAIYHVYENLLRSDVERRMRVSSVQSRPYNLEDLSWNSSHTTNEEVSPLKYSVTCVVISVLRLFCGGLSPDFYRMNWLIV